MIFSAYLIAVHPDAVRAKGSGSAGLHTIIRGDSEGLRIEGVVGGRELDPSTLYRVKTLIIRKSEDDTPQDKTIAVGDCIMYDGVEILTVGESEVAALLGI